MLATVAIQTLRNSRSREGGRTVVSVYEAALLRRAQKSSSAASKACFITSALYCLSEERGVYAASAFAARAVRNFSEPSFVFTLKRPKGRAPLISDDGLTLCVQGRELKEIYC
jgi:hypothetical protein